MHNDSDTKQRVTLAMTFPGPSEDEIGEARLLRNAVTEGNVSGISVDAGEELGYFLGAMDEDGARVGGDLNAEESAWSKIATALPTNQGAGASAAVDFELDAGQTRTVRFVLAWYKRSLIVNGRHQYIHAYASRFANVTAVAAKVGREHESLLKRIISWQEAVYGEESLPDWLRLPVIAI